MTPDTQHTHPADVHAAKSGATGATGRSRAILAIDPSDSVHAWALLAGTLEAPELRNHGRDLAEYTVELHNRVVCEMVACYGMPAGASLFDTCVAIGRLDAQFDGCLELITRTEVKLVLCGHTRAKDPNVRQTIIDRFGGPAAVKKGGPLHGVAGDTWAAIAVGLAAMHPEARLYVPAAQRSA